MSNVAPVLDVPTRTASKVRTARAPKVALRTGRRVLGP